MSAPADLPPENLPKSNLGTPFARGHDPRRWMNGAKRSRPRVMDAFFRIANRQIDGTTKTELDELCQAVWDKAKRGDSKCAALVFDRMEGKAVQPVEDVTPQQEATAEEIRERIKRLAIKLASEGVDAHAE
jgi:hypothetical protein